MAENKSYFIEKEGERLIFRTESFKAEKGSILHSGIFSKELASSLASGGIVIVLLMISLFSGIKMRFAHVFLAILIFALGLIALRLTVFKEEALEVVFDRYKGVSVSIKKFPVKRVFYPVSELKTVRTVHSVFEPENIDGLKVVEKIALQHGTVIPGFGKAKEFYTVEIVLKDGRRLPIFSGTEYDAGLIEKLIKEHLA